MSTGASKLQGCFYYGLVILTLSFKGQRYMSVYMYMYMCMCIIYIYVYMYVVVATNIDHG